MIGKSGSVVYSGKNAMLSRGNTCTRLDGLPSAGISVSDMPASLGLRNFLADSGRFSGSEVVTLVQQLIGLQLTPHRARNSAVNPTPEQ